MQNVLRIPACGGYNLWKPFSFSFNNEKSPKEEQLTSRGSCSWTSNLLTCVKYILGFSTDVSSIRIDAVITVLCFSNWTRSCHSQTRITNSIFSWINGALRLHNEASRYLQDCWQRKLWNLLTLIYWGERSCWDMPCLTTVKPEQKYVIVRLICFG